MRLTPEQALETFKYEWFDPDLAKLDKTLRLPPEPYEPTDLYMGTVNTVRIPDGRKTRDVKLTKPTYDLTAKMINASPEAAKKKLIRLLGIAAARKDPGFFGKLFEPAHAQRRRDLEEEIRSMPADVAKDKLIESLLTGELHYQGRDSLFDIIAREQANSDVIARDLHNSGSIF